MRRPGALLLVAAVLCGVSACGGERTISVDRLSSLVLTDRDLPRPFSPFFIGRQTNVDASSAIRADPTRFGRKDGWIARFHRSGSTKTPGPLVVVSRADLFGGSGGAKQDLQAYGSEFAHEPGTGHRLKVPRIGDQAIGETFTEPGAAPVRYVVVAWRYRNVSASVTAEGFARRMPVEDAVRLAQRQQQRIAGA